MPWAQGWVVPGIRPARPVDELQHLHAGVRVIDERHGGQFDAELGDREGDPLLGVRVDGGKVTGFRSSGMVDAFLRCHRARLSCIMRNLLIPCLEELETGDGTAGVACPALQATAPVRRQGR